MFFGRTMVGDVIDTEYLYLTTTSNNDPCGRRKSSLHGKRALYEPHPHNNFQKEERKRFLWATPDEKNRGIVSPQIDGSKRTNYWSSKQDDHYILVPFFGGLYVPITDPKTITFSKWLENKTNRFCFWRTCPTREMGRGRPEKPTIHKVYSSMTRKHTYKLIITIIRSATFLTVGGVQSIVGLLHAACVLPIRPKSGRREER